VAGGSRAAGLPDSIDPALIECLFPKGRVPEGQKKSHVTSKFFLPAAAILASGAFPVDYAGNETISKQALGVLLSAAARRVVCALR